MAELQRVEDLFHAVADLPAAERAAILDERCRSDSDLRREVDELLEAENREPDFMKTGREYEEAEALLVDNYPRIAEATGSGSMYTRAAARRLVQLYVSWEKPDEAAKYRRPE